MIKGQCEHCGSFPPKEDGSWAMHDYCAKCSKDLCETCMQKPCQEGGAHQAANEEDEAE